VHARDQEADEPTDALTRIAMKNQQHKDNDCQQRASLENSDTNITSFDGNNLLHAQPNRCWYSSSAISLMSRQFFTTLTP